MQAEFCSSILCFIPCMPCGKYVYNTPSRHPPCPRFYGNAGQFEPFVSVNGWNNGLVPGSRGGKLTLRPSCPLLTGGIYGDFYEFFFGGGGLFTSCFFQSAGGISIQEGNFASNPEVVVSPQ
jgi:hypothetical protein